MFAKQFKSWILAFAVLAGAVACSGGDDDSGDDNDQLCAPGQSVSCICSDGSSGAQACNDMGNGYDPCVCGGGGKDDDPADPADPSPPNDPPPADPGVQCVDPGGYCTSPNDCCQSGSTAPMGATCIADTGMCHAKCYSGSECVSGCCASVEGESWGVCASPDYCGLCSNSCQFANDGVCDDGGSGSSWDVCDYGTDCADCGPR